ncbi:hypothetical protein RFI_25406, partial [Reticulomyxa filosa]
DDEKKEQMEATYIKLNTVHFDKEELRSQLLDLFLPLCQPEEVIKAKINEDIQFYSLCIYSIIPFVWHDTNKKGKAVTDQKEKSRNQMLMMITNDVERNIPIEWLHCTKKIASFKKISEFENTIAEFFKCQASGDVLIFQHRHTPKSSNQLEQVIHILQLKHYLFYSDPNNSKKKKLVRVALSSNISTVKREFSLKLEPMLIISFLLLKITESGRSCILIDLFKCAHQAFGKLHFSHSFKSLEEKKILRLIFEDKEFENCRNLLVERLKGLLSNATENRSIDDFLQDLEKGKKKGIEGSFFARRRNNIDTLLTLALVNILFVIYQNGGFANYAESKKNEEDGHQWYSELFEKALKNRKLVEMKPPNFYVDHLLLFAIQPRLYSVQDNFQFFFPFGHCIHKWYQHQLATYSDSPSTGFNSCATTLEQRLIESDDLTIWNAPWPAKSIHKYAMDLIQNYFLCYARILDQQTILRDILVSITLLLCKRLSIASIEVTMHYFHHIIFHYSCLIFASSMISNDLSKVGKQIMRENDPGQWLADTTLSLWESIPVMTNFTASVSQLFLPKSIAVVLDFVRNYLQNNTNLVNKILKGARKIEIKRLRTMYLQIDPFVDNEKHLIEEGFLKHEILVTRILEINSTPNEKYSLFVQDLLDTIKRVEQIEENGDKHKEYASILSKLYFKVAAPICKMQILKEMVIYGNLNLHSDESILVNRCLESILLNKQVNTSTNVWRKWCNPSNKSNIGLVVKISQIKVSVTEHISTMMDKDIDLSLEKNVSLNKINQLLSSFIIENEQYKHTLYVWFLKQLYVWKGILWIAILLRYQGIELPNKMSRLLPEKPSYRNIFDPLSAMYGYDNNSMKDVHTRLVNAIAASINKRTPNVENQSWIIAQSLSLINVNCFTFFYSNLSMQIKAIKMQIFHIDLIKYLEISGFSKQEIFNQIFTHFISSGNDKQLYWKPLRDTLDLIVIRLCFHFMAVLSFMKSNPFRLLFIESELFLSNNAVWELDPDFKIHCCLHNHPLLINTSESKGIKCPLKGCGATVARTSSELENTRSRISIWFVLKRYYTFPKKTEPNNLKPLTSILLRLLYHLLLLLRNEGISQNKNKIQELVKQTNKQDTSNFLWKQIKQDFKRLKIQTKLNEELLNFSEKFETWYPQGLACDTLSEIYEFEKKLDEEYSTFFYSR